MAWATLTVQEKEIFGGHLSLIGCCLFYLIWWWMAFRPGSVPGAARVTGLAGVLLGITAACGVVGLVLVVLGIRGGAPGAVLLPGGWIAGGGAVLYLALLALTALLLHRPVTTELFLIVGWAVLETAAVSTLYGTGALGRGTAIGLLAVVAEAFAAGMVCYLLYYRLSAWAGFVSGMIPLAVDAVAMAVVALCMR